MKRKSITVYDYDDRPTTIQLPDKDIRLLHVTLLSGDETGYVQFEDDTIQEFDASDCRIQGFFGGNYTVIDKEELAKWFDWVPEVKKFLSYERKSMMWHDKD